jgi:hypothetical protein
VGFAHDVGIEKTATRWCVRAQLAKFFDN